MKHFLIFIVLLQVTHGTLLFPHSKPAQECIAEMKKERMYGPNCTRHAKHLRQNDILYFLELHDGYMKVISERLNVIGYVLSQEVKCIDTWE